ncbi:MAG: 1,4-beta-xylanase, partial [Aestuariibaculum sp.]
MKRIITNTTNKIFIAVLIAFGIVSCKNEEKKDTQEEPLTEIVEKRGIWTKEKATEWYSHQPWLVGANFNPSSSINQLEMWQKDTFDPERIDQELGWAENIGMNCMRVYLHDLLYKDDAAGLFSRMEQYLRIAEKHHIKTLFVLFDSCWDPFPESGVQRAPKPHVHNSGWVQSPGQKVLQDSTQYGRLESYVKETVGHFKNDTRILGWDVWNEPDNMTGSSYEAVEIPNKVDLVLNLLDDVFVWARSVNPSQPLTSGVWIGDWSSHEAMTPLRKLQIEQSDIITVHNYDTPEIFENRIQEWHRYGTPMICTESMARPNG